MHSGSSPAPTRYRERLSPSMGFLVGSIVFAPMIAFTLLPVGAVIGVVAGISAGVAVVALLVGFSPVVEVENGMLRAGRARIDTALLGEPEVYTGQEARRARGLDLDPRSWHLLRSGIDGVLVVPVVDPDDPAPAWVISSRTPDRLAAAVRRSRTTPSTPRR